MEFHEEVIPEERKTVFEARQGTTDDCLVIRGDTKDLLCTKLFTIRSCSSGSPGGNIYLESVYNMEWIVRELQQLTAYAKMQEARDRRSVEETQ